MKSNRFGFMKRKSEGEFGVENTFGLKNQIARLKFKLRIFISHPEAAILIHTKLFDSHKTFSTNILLLQSKKSPVRG